MAGSIIDGLIRYKELIEYEPEMIILDKVTWKRSFGPWPIGKYCQSISFLFDKGLIVEYDKEGKEVKSCTIELRTVP